MDKSFYGIILIFLSFIGAAFSPIKVSTGKHGSSKRKPITKYGTASFYSDRFNGKCTAIGNVYNFNKYTAACNVLPMNTCVQVTNLRNHLSVIVKINDRLNPRNNRLIDVSKTAAEKLGFVSRGLAKVKVIVLNDNRSN